MWQGQVLPGWIDYNGHMTESRYYFCNSETIDNFLRLIGAGMDYVAAGHSFYSAETHIRHLDEAKLGDRLRGELQIISADEKRFRSFVWVMKGDDLRRDGGTGLPACRHEGKARPRLPLRRSGRLWKPWPRPRPACPCPMARVAPWARSGDPRVLITAGANGIGLVMARAFAARGDRVWVTDVDAAMIAALPPASAVRWRCRQRSGDGCCCSPRSPRTGAGWMWPWPMPGSRVRRRRSKTCRWRAGTSALPSIWTARCCWRAVRPG
jgi:acyl-CoA thioesterase FadM